MLLIYIRFVLENPYLNGLGSYLLSFIGLSLGVEKLNS